MKNQNVGMKAAWLVAIGFAVTLSLSACKHTGEHPQGEHPQEHPATNAPAQNP